MNKIEAFEYFAYKLTLIQKKSGKDENDISFMKAMKLLFLSVAASSKRDDFLLREVFNNFYAYPFGPSEKDIYDYVVSNSIDFVTIKLKHISISNKQTIAHDENFEKSAVTDAIDLALDDLLKENPKIVMYRPFDLVDLTHKWFSWQVNFQKAKMAGKSKEKMELDEIKNNRHVYYLSPFA
jgi:hypothetical protein